MQGENEGFIWQVIGLGRRFALYFPETQVLKYLFYPQIS